MKSPEKPETAPDVRYPDEGLKRINDEFEDLTMEAERTDPMVAASMRRLLEKYREQEEVARTLRHEARIDHLTQLFNARAFDQSIVEKIATAERHKENLHIVAIDIDNFKAINDTYGHAIGNLYLQSISQHLRGALRRDDILARVGGDEFAIILVNVTDAQATIVGDKLREAVSTASAEAKQELQKLLGEILPANAANVTGSIGHSSYGGAETPADLRERADYAAYVVKKSGGHHSYSYEEALALDSDGRLQKQFLTEKMKNERVSEPRNGTNG